MKHNLSRWFIFNTPLAKPAENGYSGALLWSKSDTRTTLMPMTRVAVTITVTRFLIRIGVPAGTFLPAISTSQPHAGQRQPPSIQWRFVLLNGDINLGSSRPQSGQGFCHRKDSNMTKKGKKGAMPAKTEK
jgi:hypothetical protein